MNESPPTQKSVLEKVLIKWVEEKAANGINQHDRKWLEEKVLMWSGSIMASLVGLNPHQSLYQVVEQKIGLKPFESKLAMQWGNLFEPSITIFVEIDRGCKVYGEDLYVRDRRPNIAYSPDGLAVLDVIEPVCGGFSDDQTDTAPRIPRTTIVLMEFKCPFSRIPAKEPPPYYVPQVKMGLDVLELPTIGLFVEGVFRRCTLDQLGPNPEFERTLVNRGCGDLSAYGFIGFYHDPEAFAAVLEDKRLHNEPVEPLIAQFNDLIIKYNKFYAEYGTQDNDYFNNDIGESPVDLFTLIMSAFNNKILQPNYYNMVYIGENKQARVNDELNPEKHTKFCADGKYHNFGVLPWKLFKVAYHYIKKDLDYLGPYISRINEVMSVVKNCVENPARKVELYNDYVRNCVDRCFSDGV